MTLVLQGSLLDIEQPLRLHPIGEGLRRAQLGNGAWLDLRRAWCTGGDTLVDTLVAEVPWRAERRPMYDTVVDVPRLTCFYGAGEALPHPALTAARQALSAHYAAELGEPFVTAGLCLYRDGADSVAWHGDRLGRSRDRDTMVAILSLGAERPLSLRPRDGGASLKVPLAHGDLVVMGGSCQRTFDHAVLKTARPVGPRISVQFRVRGVL